MSNRAIWTARCKSGYQFKGKPCNRACSRGMLLCSECITATVVDSPVQPHTLSSLLRYWVSCLLTLNPLAKQHSITEGR